MTNEEKKAQIKLLVCDMLSESSKAMINNIDNVINSGAIDVDGWDAAHNQMILPKCIVAALLQRESTQYEGKGTSFERKLKKEVNNIKHYI